MGACLFRARKPCGLEFDMLGWQQANEGVGCDCCGCMQLQSLRQVRLPVVTSDSLLHLQVGYAPAGWLAALRWRLACEIEYMADLTACICRARTHWCMC